LSTSSWAQIAIYLALLLILVRPLGAWMARVYEAAPPPTRLERALYRMTGVKPEEEMDWQTYSGAVLLFSGLGIVAVYVLQQLQGLLPLNPQTTNAVSPDLAFNTAVSFVTNTNWQSYSGETTLSYFTQLAALTTQNFVSAATGLAVLIALIRGFTRQQAGTIGSFWVDLTRGTLYILLPLSLVLALVLVSQGVVQTVRPAAQVELVQPIRVDTALITTQTLARGPVASQVAIKQLGTNGGGFFNVNSAHPFENPTPLSDFLELLAILLIPAAACYCFGRLVKDRRQGWAILAAMTLVFVALLLPAVLAEAHGNPRLASLVTGGNMEGKEVRFGIGNSALWATATTAASNGSVNAMHDSFTPLGGLVPLWLIQVGEVIYGGVGSGLYGMLMIAIVAVFVAGLMVGRTPEYLGKKIEAYEMKMAALTILAPNAAVLIGSALAVATAAGRAGVFNPGPHGFTEILYAFSSAANNNGSAFGGIGANTPFYNVALGLAMWIGRFWIIVPVLALAGSLAAKKRVPEGAGTLPTHTPLFVALLIGTVVLVGALTHLPGLALGPIAEHLIVGSAP
jgi:K+-transporting ATPase ATPase A chain